MKDFEIIYIINNYTLILHIYIYMDFIYFSKFF